MDGPHDSIIRERLERLEEAHLFADRAAEELNRAVLDLAERVDAIAKRLSALENRLDAIADDDEQDEAKPAQD